MTPSKPKYCYAFDESNNLINVLNATKKSLYRCLNCGREMYPRQGSEKEWHFAHKQECICNNETYLHKLAKMLIRKDFLESKNFYIHYDALHECINSCPINKHIKCYSYQDIDFDLKLYYDSCEEEVNVDGRFIADLLLSSSINPDKPKTLIEIYVTHKSTIEKINYGHRIIEIRIKSEDDILRITKNHTIGGMNYNNIDSENYTTFYNFNKSFPIQNSPKINQRIYLYCVRKDGVIFNKQLQCYESFDEIISNGFNVLCVDTFVNWQWVFHILKKDGVNIKNCTICRYYNHSSYKGSFCNLYKKFGTPQHPKTNIANSCQYFYPNKYTDNDWITITSNTMNVEYWKNYKPSYKLFLAK